MLEGQGTTPPSSRDEACGLMAPGPRDARRDLARSPRYESRLHDLVAVRSRSRWARPEVAPGRARGRSPSARGAPVHARTAARIEAGCDGMRVRFDARLRKSRDHVAARRRTIA